MKQYRDKDGDVWEDRPDRMMEVVKATSYPAYVGQYIDRQSVELNYGPLTEVNPNADADMSRAIRAELAIVFQELADEAYSDFRGSEGVDADVSYRVQALFESKSQALRAEATE